jgi:hypothetical protein
LSRPGFDLAREVQDGLVELGRGEVDGLALAVGGEAQAAGNAFTPKDCDSCGDGSAISGPDEGHVIRNCDGPDRHRGACQRSGDGALMDRQKVSMPRGSPWRVPLLDWTTADEVVFVAEGAEGNEE